MRIKKWLALVFISGGIILISYPLFLQFQAFQEQRKLEKEFEEKLSESNGLNEDISGKKQEFAGKSTLFKLAIPSIDLEAFILPASGYEDIEGNSILSPVHMPGTALPGEAGNLAVAGHRFGPGSYFRYLDRVSPGDEIIVQTTEKSFTYQVEKVYLTCDHDLGVLNQTENFAITLITCHREGLAGYNQRLIVRGKMLSD